MIDIFHKPGHTHTHICTQTQLWGWDVRVSLCVCVYVCLHLCEWIFVVMCLCVCVCVCVFVCMCVFVFMCVCEWVYRIQTIILTTKVSFDKISKPSSIIEACYNMFYKTFFKTITRSNPIILWWANIYWPLSYKVIWVRNNEVYSHVPYLNKAHYSCFKNSVCKSFLTKCMTLSNQNLQFKLYSIFNDWNCNIVP